MANSLDVKEQYKHQLKYLQEAYGEAMLELRARQKLQAFLGMRGDSRRSARLAAEGFRMALAKLCRWFDVPRRTVYYRPIRRAPKVQTCFSEPIKALIKESLSFWLPNRGAFAGHKQEHRAARVPA